MPPPVTALCRWACVGSLGSGHSQSLELYISLFFASHFMSFLWYFLSKTFVAVPIIKNVFWLCTKPCFRNEFHDLEGEMNTDVGLELPLKPSCFPLSALFLVWEGIGSYVDVVVSKVDCHILLLKIYLLIPCDRSLNYTLERRIYT